jgi:hypothetical protein
VLLRIGSLPIARKLRRHAINHRLRRCAADFALSRGSFLFIGGVHVGTATSTHKVGFADAPCRELKIAVQRRLPKSHDGKPDVGSKAESDELTNRLEQRRRFLDSSRMGCSARGDQIAAH